MSRLLERSPQVEAAAEQPSPTPGITAWCARVAASRGFEVTIVVAIAANAVLLGLETYPDLRSAGWLNALEWLFRAVFVAEIAVRLLSYGRRPQDFFRHGWNVFDLAVVAAAFVPGLHGDSAILRVIRIARVVRLMRFMPGLRTIVTALLRSLPGVGGFLALAVVTLYIYGMAGWLIFAEHQPEQYGTIGSAVLTLFVLLSLENLPDLIEQGMALSPWTVVFYISYVLITANLLVNILVGVIINSMEEARRLEQEPAPGAGSDSDARSDDVDRAMMARRLADMRALLDDLERDMRVGR
ncbi:ion transporter [Catellatospora citrea]|uniref:ion transporter n=1 Tax=Catellatospora citrea TaxID=53366 RepID=UPI000E75F2A0|nr:ion transporter [Catellatospora citrea]RKE00356.1 voltage-gated sodium channel [Catellatospora citrea]